MSRLSVFCLMLVALIFALAPAASGQEIPYRSGFGSELAYQCKAYVRDTSSPNGSQCLGYIDGFLDGRTSSPRAGNHLDTTKTFCWTDASLDTVIKVYLAFMEKNPKYLDYEKWKTLMMALHDAYPCK